MNNNANLDTKEVEKFGSLADSWWDPTGPFAPLHGINTPRLEYIQRNADIKGKAILDVGCGAGILTESLVKAGANVIGLDASPKVIDVAIEHAKLSDLKIEYQNSTIEEYIDTYDNHFDVITCMELIEHVPSPAQLIKDCAQLLKPGGKLFISTINRTPKAYLFAIIGAEYVLKILPKNTHDYKKFITPAEMQELCTDAGLSFTDISGMKYSPFTKQAHLCADTNINYLGYCVKNGDII